MPSCNGMDRAKDTRERRLTRGTMDGLRKADDGLSSGILFSSTVGVATQQVVLCSDWCASTGQPESTPSNARTRPVTSSTGKRSAVKVACCVWTGGKSASSYLSVLLAKMCRKPALRSNCELKKIIKLTCLNVRALLHKIARILVHPPLECGFANQSHLSLVFKRHLGLTPRAYRQDRPI